MPSPNLTPFGEVLVRILRGELDDCSVHDPLYPALRSPGTDFTSLVQNSTLPPEHRKLLIDAFTQTSSESVSDTRKSRYLGQEYPLPAPLPRVVDLRNVNELRTRNHESPAVPKPAESDDTYTFRNSKQRRVRVMSDIRLRLLNNPDKLTPLNRPVFNFASTDILLFGEQSELEIYEKWSRLGRAVRTQDIPALVGSKHIAIAIEEWLLHQWTPVLWPNNWSSGFEELAFKYSFLRDLSRDTIVYVYWGPNESCKSFRIPLPRNTEPSPLGGKRCGEVAFSVVVDLYDEEWMAEMMALRDILIGSLPEPERVEWQRRHGSPCVACQYRKWHWAIRGPVEKWSLVPFAGELLSNPRQGWELEEAYRVFGLRDQPLRTDSPWVKEKLREMPLIRPCIVFDFEY